MTIERQILGKIGEDLAVAALEARGYAILERRYRTDRGEIDIIADDEGTIVFVEVKARESREFGDAAEAVTRRKQLQVVSLAVEYLARRRLNCRPCRFDVVAIDDALSDRPEVTVYPGAFDVTG
jgi:putative endonuclease